MIRQAHRYHQLRHLSVIGGFLDGAKFDLTSGLNCVIGPRGAGKTTVLEFIRYAMDALPASGSEERRRIESLIERNLRGGRIEVLVETRDGLEFIVSRTAKEAPIVLNTDGTPTEISVQSLFRVHVFSQNEVELIADSPELQLELIDSFEPDRIADVQDRIHQVQLKLVQNGHELVRLDDQQGRLAEKAGGLEMIEARLEQLTETEGAEADAVNEAHKLKALRDREEWVVDDATKLLAKTAATVQSLVGLVTRETEQLLPADLAESPNSGLLKDLVAQLATCGTDTDRLLRDVAQRIGTVQKSIEDTAGKLHLAHKQQEMEYRKTIEQHEIARNNAAERAAKERERNELLAKNRTRDAILAQVDRLHATRRDLLAELSLLRDERFNIRQEIVDRINSSVEGIRVTLHQFGNRQGFGDFLEHKLRRSHQGKTAYKVAANISPAELSEIVRDELFDALVDQANVGRDTARKVIRTLSDPGALFELETVELEDAPTIELKDGDEYKRAKLLSTGQKCTAILPILLLDSENPLLVDQPEDNLDNRFIYETIIKFVQRVKSRRQLIFVTHNPNIPVLGEADQVFVLDSDGQRARKAKQGTVEDCKSQILRYLEGGRAAFNARGRKYA